MSQMQEDEVFYCNDSGRKEFTAAATLTRAVAHFDKLWSFLHAKNGKTIFPASVTETLLSTSWNMSL